MKTRVLKIDRNNIDAKQIRIAADVLKRGGIVAFPTETVYGLGADALNPLAVKKIFRAKGRPSDNPLIVHISDLKMLTPLVKSVPKDTRALMKIYWPGPLTIIFQKTDKVPLEVTAGLSTVAIRMPSHPIAKALIEAAGVPIAAPSANLSGKPSPTTGQDAIDDLNGRVPIIIDGGRADIGVESTVLDLTKKPYTILRPGGVPIESLRQHIQVRQHPAIEGKQISKGEVPESPGMKYRHYAPKAKLIVFRGPDKKVASAIRELSKEFRSQHLKVGVLSPFYDDFNSDMTITPGQDKSELAGVLFWGLREFDKEGMDVILVAGVNSKGLGRAVMNRLEKAAVYKVIEL